MVDAHWRRFIELMGDPEWADDERLQNRWLTFQWADEIDPLWHPWLAERTKAELTKTFAENRLPFHAVQTIDEIVSADHLEARDFWVETEHPEVGGPIARSALRTGSPKPRGASSALRRASVSTTTIWPAAAPGPSALASRDLRRPRPTARCRGRASAYSTTGTSGLARCWRRSSPTSAPR